jgi:L-seryl-tRNA(Ser) seleniumtransferase
VAVDLMPSEAAVGGGSLPGQTLPSFALRLGPFANGGADVDAIARRLRLGEPGVFGRIVEDRLALDLRTILPEQDDLLARAVVAALDS